MMTVDEAALLIEAASTVQSYEMRHCVEVWKEFYDFAEKMLPIVEAGMQALSRNPIDPWEEAYVAMDKAIEEAFGIKLKDEEEG